ncbi:hypothetical protein [Psychrobacillus lasiicapitis]|uniref:S1 motif domain-containing protein n=1 Tax=Psychrobacillus lasiicapitis TaxID=1636719 RepID=A0A544T2T2_9BACI|nr:hypothetical protein [Psychrobacillus lasiicapitis]TQR11738.1 hypothetical protein FG382_14065 [Psychrobacillus lasiicapitis]GGA19096.1 hypothetical protein GCM10011384_05440 [Psychrobacillus lasiicapitis]
MFKFTPYILMLSILFFSCFPSSLQVQASTLVSGMFVDVTYEEVMVDKKTTEKQLSKITLINDKGKTITLNIDSYASLFINSTPTSIGAFKEGMWVEATVELRNVKELNGFVDIAQGSDSQAIGESLTGTVNTIDRSGKFIAINSKERNSVKYYLDAQTKVIKDNKLVDLSVLYEGDRVKLTLSENSPSTLSTIEIVAEGIKVEQLYKGTVQQIDAKKKKLVVKDEKVFRNWDWRNTSANKGNISSKAFTAKTPIYVGTKKVDSNQLRNYINNEIYYVTIEQMGQEVVQKMIIKQSNERNLHEGLNSVDTSAQKIRLSSTGNLAYHNGTIIIRNGRLVDASALSQSGDAYVITNGTTTHQYANVIYVTNDGFQSANLSNHEVYFGQISSVGSYRLTLTNANRLSNNYWYGVGYSNLSFSEDTVVVEDANSWTADFTNSTSKYAYFYVKDNHIVAARIVGWSSPASFISVGRYSGNWNWNSIQVKDVSQWQAGNWIESNPIYYMDTTWTTFIKEGKVISKSDLEENDRLYIIHDTYSQARIILVD